MFMFGVTVPRSCARGVCLGLCLESVPGPVPFFLCIYTLMIILKNIIIMNTVNIFIRI